jgi:hypothetical protein
LRRLAVRTVRETYAAARSVQPPLADAMRAYGGRPPARPSVVVVGESRRGKSSLVNSLLGRPGLSPVGAHLGTSAYLVFQHGESEQALVAAGPAEEPMPVPIAELSRWAGGPASPAGVVRIDVTVHAPVLEGLVLVDTPGVGGLAGHGAVTLKALEEATALIFVLDATGVLTRPELDFLREASERTDEVVFVLTKHDCCPGWRTVLTEDRALLARHAPRFADAPFVVVSNLLAEEALSVSDAELAAQLQAESGIEGLAAVLHRRIAPNAQTLALLNLLRLSRSVLTELDHTLREQAAAADADPALRASWVRERDRLDALQRETSAWQAGLENQFAHVRTDLNRRLTAGVAELRRHWDARLVDEPIGGVKNAEEVEQVETRLAAELTAQLSGLSESLRSRLSERARELAAGVLGDCLASVQPSGLDGLLAGPAPEVPLPPAMRTLQGGERLLDEMRNLASGRMTGMALLTPISVIGGVVGGPLALVAAPLSALSGLAFLGISRKYRNRAQRRQELRSWAREAVAEAGTAIRTDVDDVFADARHEVVSLVRATLRQRAEDVKRALAVSDRALRQDREARARSRRAVATQLAGIRKLAVQTDRLLTGCTALLDNAPTAAVQAREEEK